MLIVFAGMASAVEISWGGYLRDDITVTDRHLGAVVGNYLGNYLRLRVDLKAYMNEHASLTATPEFTYLSGDRLLDPYTGLPLASDHDVGLNRAQLDLWWERLQITLGKQRLQLSNAYFFSSLDVFNPANYTEPTVGTRGGYRCPHDRLLVGVFRRAADLRAPAELVWIRPRRRALSSRWAALRWAPPIWNRATMQ